MNTPDGAVPSCPYGSSECRCTDEAHQRALAEMRRAETCALLAAPEPPRRETSEYALAARSTLERELVRALHHERLRVQEAIVLGQKRTEAMQDHAVKCFDEVLEGSITLRARFLELLGGSPRASAKQANFMAGEIGRFGSGARLWPQTHGRPTYKTGDLIITDDGKEGTVTGPPNEKHPHTARVALEDGQIYDLWLSRIRPRFR